VFQAPAAHRHPCPAWCLPQFPKLFEASAIRLVHHSVETAEQLSGSILAHLGAHFVQVWAHTDGGCAPVLLLVPDGMDECIWWRVWPLLRAYQKPPTCGLCVPLQGEELAGTRVDGSTASCVVCEVQEPQRQPRGGAAAAAAKENGAAAGQDSEATEDDEKEAAEAAAEEGDEEEEQQPADPDAIVYVVEWLGEGGAPGGERASLRRSQLQRAESSPLAALTGPFLQLWVETVATAEPVAVRCCCFCKCVCWGWCSCMRAGGSLIANGQSMCTCCRRSPSLLCLPELMVQGVAGISCLWRVAEYWRQLYSLPEQLPAEMAERLRPARQKALYKVPSALQQAGAGSDEEPGAAAAGGGGEDNEEAEYDPGGWVGGVGGGQPAACC
jgi:hypothetical protein